jgi:hypothetical protein
MRRGCRGSGSNLRRKREMWGRTISTASGPHDVVAQGQARQLAATPGPAGPVHEHRQQPASLKVSSTRRRPAPPATKTSLVSRSRARGPTCKWRTWASFTAGSSSQPVARIAASSHEAVRALCCSDAVPGSVRTIRASSNPWARNAVGLPAAAPLWPSRCQPPPRSHGPKVRLPQQLDRGRVAPDNRHGGDVDHEGNFLQAVKDALHRRRQRHIIIRRRCGHRRRRATGRQLAVGPAQGSQSGPGASQVGFLAEEDSIQGGEALLGCRRHPCLIQSRHRVLAAPGPGSHCAPDPPAGPGAGRCAPPRDRPGI